MNKTTLLREWKKLSAIAKPSMNDMNEFGTIVQGILEGYQKDFLSAGYPYANIMFFTGGYKDPYYVSALCQKMFNEVKKGYSVYFQPLGCFPEDSLPTRDQEIRLINTMFGFYEKSSEEHAENTAKINEQLEFAQALNAHLIRKAS